jgi:hypothetical protein
MRRKRELWLRPTSLFEISRENMLDIVRAHRIDHRPVFAIFNSKEKSLLGLCEAAGLNVTCDLRSVDLSGLDLTGEDLRGFDLTRANLRGTNIEKAKVDITTRLVKATLDDDLDVDVDRATGKLAVVKSKAFYSSLIKEGDRLMGLNQLRAAVPYYRRAKRIVIKQINVHANDVAWLKRYGDVLKNLALAWAIDKPDASHWHLRKSERVSQYLKLLNKRRKSRRDPRVFQFTKR